MFIFASFFSLYSYQDPSNLQGKVQKHQAFEAELSANQSRIDALQKSGQELIDGKHYASSEVSTRMDEVSSQWKKLLEATELKGEKIAQCDSTAYFTGKGSCQGLKTMFFWFIIDKYETKGRFFSDLTLFTCSGIKLREANQQQQFNRNVEDIELWLYEVEGHLASDDFGKDLTSVQNLQKKHALLEADVAAHQVTMSEWFSWMK